MPSVPRTVNPGAVPGFAPPKLILSADSRSVSGTCYAGVSADGTETAVTSIGWPARPTVATRAAVTRAANLARGLGTIEVISALRFAPPLRAQTGTVAAGAAATATAVKVAVTTGTCTAGTSATASVTSQFTQAAPRALVATQAAMDRAAALYRRTAPARVVAAPQPPPAATAETGTATAGIAATGTARKVATVSATSTAGATASGTARKVASVSAIGTVGAAAIGTVGAASPQAWPARPYVVNRAALRRAIDAYGPVPAGFLDFGAPQVLSSGTDTGLAAAGLTASGTARKVAVVTGRSTVGAQATATARKVASGSSRSCAGVTATSTAAKKATVTGTSYLGVSGRGFVGTLVSRAQTGTSTAGVSATAAPRKVAAPLGAAVLAVIGTGTARKRAQPSAAALAGLSCQGSPRKRSASSGRAFLGIFPFEAETVHQVTGRAYLGLLARARYRGWIVRPNTGTTTRPSSGRTSRPFTGVTLRPPS